MQRRQFLLASGLTLGASAIPLGWVSAASGKKQRLLYFTRSSGFEHSVVKRNKGELAHSEKILTELGKQVGFDVECTKDGTVFDGDLSKYDCVAFYTSGDLTKPDDPKKPVNGGAPPMTAEGKKKLLAAIAGGLGFVGFHSASDSFHTPGPRDENQPEDKVDPYLHMLGGEFIVHGAQQDATIINTSPNFPGTEAFGKSVRMKEEWYALKNFTPDLHVILVQDCAGMKDPCYQRPPFPATWARMEGKGRVFYTSYGHREDIWTNEMVQKLILGGIAWTMKNVNVDVKPNLKEAAPGGSTVPKLPPPAKKTAPAAKKAEPAKK